MEIASVERLEASRDEGTYKGLDVEWLVLPPCSYISLSLTAVNKLLLLAQNIAKITHRESSSSFYIIPLKKFLIFCLLAFVPIFMRINYDCLSGRTELSTSLATER